MKFLIWMLLLVASVNAYAQTAKEKVFYATETVPEYPGGMDAFNQYVATHIRYPAVAQENNTQGKVIIAFVVDTAGRLTDFVVKQGIGSGCDEEVIRVLKSCRSWTAGTQNGRKVRVQYSFPFSFSLKEPDPEPVKPPTKSL